jgi:hypothetical protein
MPRKRLVSRERRAGFTVDELDVLTDAELIRLTIDAPGATTVGRGEKWHASPGHGNEAERILRARGAWG